MKKRVVGILIVFILLLLGLLVYGEEYSDGCGGCGLDILEGWVDTTTVTDPLADPTTSVSSVPGSQDSGESPTPGTPTCVGNEGSACNCGACGCGGTIQCDGSCSGSNPTPSNHDSSCGSCGGTIQCDGACSVSTPPNFGQSCGNCGTIACDSSCVNQGVCALGQTQCVNGKYQSCSNSCGWTNTGTDADNDGVDQQCEDATCDNAQAVCDSAIGSCIAKTLTETSCTDSLDNDCDGLTDCQDSDCAGSISGNVKNTDNQNIADGTVDVLQGTSSKYKAYTNNLGNYQSNTVLCGTYNMVASATGYVSSTQTNINIPPKTPITINFNDNYALVSGSICETDCTYTGDNTIHKECSGINGCLFYDAIAANACNFAQPGWIRDYSDAKQIQCAEGAPYDKITVKATVSCPKENLITTTSIVNYNGKMVKMHIAVCG